MSVEPVVIGALRVVTPKLRSCAGPSNSQASGSGLKFEGLATERVIWENFYIFLHTWKIYCATWESVL